MSTQRPQTAQAYLTSLSILHLALLMGQIFFAGITYYLHQSGSLQMGMSELASMLKIVVPVLVLGAIIGSHFLFKIKIAQTQTKEKLAAKLADYRVAFLLQLALMEGGALFSIMSYLLTADLWFLAMAAIVIVVFVLQRPSLQKIAETLRLSHQEKQILEKPDNIVIE
jgi:hypothetical protein